MKCWHGYLSELWSKVCGPADVTATPSSLDSLKSRMVYLSCAGLPRFVLGKETIEQLSVAGFAAAHAVQKLF